MDIGRAQAKRNKALESCRHVTLYRIIPPPRACLCVRQRLRAMRALCASGQAACLAACRADAPQAAPLFRPTECSPRSRRGAPHVHRCHAASRRRRAVELSAAVDAVLAEAQPLPSAPVFITPQPALPYDQWLSPEALRWCVT